MRSDSAPAYTAAIVAAGAALVFYSVTAPGAPPWPTPETIGASGQMLIDAISRVPFGEQATRAITLAVVMGSISSAINAWIIARGGLPVSLAVGCTLTLAFSPAVWHQATSDAPGSVAAVLVACAVAISLVQPPSRIRIVGATAAVIVGLFLQPPFRGHDTSWAVALQTLRREWLLPVIVIMCMAIAAPVWRAIPPPRLVILGALAFVVLGAIGYDVAPLVVFPALLLAEGVRLLPLSSARAKTAVVLALAALAGVDRWYATDPHEWRVLAWRDAVERAVTPCATIFTGSRAAAELNGPLFQQRPSRIRIAFESDVYAME